MIGYRSRLWSHLSFFIRWLLYFWLVDWWSAEMRLVGFGWTSLVWLFPATAPLVLLCDWVSIWLLATNWSLGSMRNNICSTTCSPEQCYLRHGRWCCLLVIIRFWCRRWDRWDCCSLCNVIYKCELEFGWRWCHFKPWLLSLQDWQMIFVCGIGSLQTFIMQHIINYPIPINQSLIITSTGKTINKPQLHWFMHCN